MDKDVGKYDHRLNVRLVLVLKVCSLYRCIGSMKTIKMNTLVYEGFILSILMYEWFKLRIL